VMLEAAETHAMWWMAVVETWIPRLCTVEVTVECGYFDADFGHQIAGEMCGECRRIIWAWVWEEV
jgi:hypothetical protein